MREHVRAVGEADGELRPLLDEQDRDAALADLRERGEDVVDHRGRESERGLVEKEQVGLGDERPRDRELLLLAAGEDARRAVAVAATTGKSAATRARSSSAPSRGRRPTSPSLRFSSTVSSGKMCRPSGTSATPERTIASGAQPGERTARVQDLPAVRAGRRP